VIATDVAGRITFLNPVAEALTGWTAAGGTGARPHRRVPHRERGNAPTSESPVAKVLRDGRVAGLANHTALIRKDGSQISIGDSGAPIRNADGTLFGAVLVFRDITEQRAEETRLQAAYEREHQIR
jgi:PAS domain S-box-containing protein